MAAVAVAEECKLVVDGTLCYVQYVEPGVEDPPYTEVLVLYELEYDDYVVANPDQEVRIEHLSLDNPDVQSFKFREPNAALPADVPREQVYAFGRISVALRKSLRQQAHALACVECDLRELGHPPPLIVPRPRVPRAAGGRGGAGEARAPPPHVDRAPLPPPPGGGGGFGGAGGFGNAGSARRSRTPPGPTHDDAEAGIAVVFETPIAFAPVAGMWVLDEPTSSHDIGVVLVLGAGTIMSFAGDRAFVMLDGEETVARKLGSGSSIKEYIEARSEFLTVDRRNMFCPEIQDGKSVAQLLRCMELKPGGLPSGIEGEPTAGWFIDAVAETGSGFLQRHHTWKHESGVSPSLPAVYEHETISVAFDLATKIDRHNLKNLAWAEWLLRRMQLQEDAVLENPHAPSYEHARHYMGKGANRGGALVNPSLVAHVASEVGKAAAILKEKRKAREARDALGLGRGRGRDGGRGRGRGKGQPGDAPAIDG